MERPHTIVGLSMELLRRRGVPPVALSLPIAFVTVLGVAVIARSRQHPLLRPSDARLATWNAAPCEGFLAFVDPAVVATEGGWIVAWTRWERSRTPQVQVAALARDGSLRGAPRTLSPDNTWARRPFLARQGDRVAVSWTARRDNSERFDPKPWFAVIDADARITVAPCSLGDADEEGLETLVASDGQGWGVGWTRINEHHRGFALARLTTEGVARGPITRVEDDNTWAASALVWTDDTWLVVNGDHDRDRVRSVLRLRWFDRGGHPIDTQRIAPSPGQVSPVHAVARDGAAWLSWGDDAGFGSRHDPRIARVEGRRVVIGPRATGPRRSGGVASLACSAFSCLTAWTGVVDDREDPAALQLQALDADGVPRGPVRRIGPPALISPWGTVGLAHAADERDTLVIWSIGEGDTWRLMQTSVDAEGTPRRTPALLPLP
ncbi:MAG: hypothetical protein KA978_06170 [Deltaproteobacteria bacterium]|jgi:hypothetical protein|nr:hypothetical protein [Deltaproteobacteria bacterium]